MKKTYFWLLAILVLGLILRLYNNTLVSLWHDEAFSALLIKYPWQEMMYRIGLDVHPPMYYIFLRFWSYLFGDSLLALRGMSIFFGLGIIVASFAFVKVAFQSEKAALIVALLIAVNPFQLQYVSEARMYTMGAFFALLAAYFLTKALRETNAYFQTKTLQVKRWALLHYAGFIISTSICIYSHYYLLFTAAALCLYGCMYHLYTYRTDFKKYSWLIASYILLALSFVPWLKVFLFQYKQVSADYWIPKMDRWSIPVTIWKMAIGLGTDITHKNTQISVVVTTLLVILVLIYFLWKQKVFEKWLVVITFLAPFVGASLFYGLSFLKCHPLSAHLAALSDCKVNSVFLDRYFLFAAGFLTITIGVWLAQFKWKRLSVLLISAYALTGFIISVHYWIDLNVDTKLGMTQAAKYLHANVTPTDKLYVGSSFEFFNLKYYTYQHGSQVCIPATLLAKLLSCQPDTSLPVKPLLFSGGNRTVSAMPHYAGTAILTDQDLLPDFNQGVKYGDTVWLLWTNGFGGSKPTVPSNWKQVSEQGFAEVRPYVGTWIIVTQYQVQRSTALRAE